MKIKRRINNKLKCYLKTISYILQLYFVKYIY